MTSEAHFIRNLFWDVMRWTDASIEVLDQDLTIEQSVELQKEALTACRDRLVSEGVDLAVFNSLENAADVDALRAALGYDRINFYGVSYGTLLGLHLIRDFPDGLRSVILDAVVPPQINFVVEGLSSQNRAFSQLFEACLADSTCSTEFPNLEESFFETVSRLNEQPVLISLTDPDTGRSYDALLNGDSLIGLTFQLLYGAEFIPALPKMINDVSEGNYSAAINILPLLVFDRTFGQGMYFSVLCAEDSDFEVDDVRLDGVRPQFTEHAAIETQTLLDVCEAWNVPELDAVVDAPVTSNVPTLLLSGRFDPITPPSFAERAAETLSNSTFYTFPKGAHGAAMGEDDCGNAIAADFLRDPATRPDASCLSEGLPISFFQSDLPRVEAIIKLANLSPGYLVRWGIAGFALLGLLTAWIVWPFAFIVNKFRARKAQAPSDKAWVDVLSRWLGLLAGMTGGLFYAGFLAVAVYAVFNLTVYLIIGSLPAWTIPLFLLLLLLVLLTAGMIIALAVAWVRGSMPVWERIFYSFLTSCAVIFLSLQMATSGRALRVSCSASMSTRIIFPASLSWL